MQEDIIEFVFIVEGKLGQLQHNIQVKFNVTLLGTHLLYTFKFIKETFERDFCRFPKSYTLPAKLRKVNCDDISRQGLDGKLSKAIKKFGFG